MDKEEEDSELVFVREPFLAVIFTLDTPCSNLIRTPIGYLY